MTTLKPSCLPQGSSSGAEAVAFFQTTVALFKELPTYQWLSAAGIVPGSTYSLSQLVAPLKAKYGATPMFDCQDGEVFQVSYYYNLKGSVLDGLWIPVDAPSKGSCTATGIKYLSKGGSSTTTTKATTTTKGTTTTPTSQPTGGSVRVGLFDQQCIRLTSSLCSCLPRLTSRPSLRPDPSSVVCLPLAHGQPRRSPPAPSSGPHPASR
jgi:ribonuclease T2